jgi:hypothetical protein
MKVYVLIEHIPYEGSEVAGIYATEALAEAARVRSQRGAYAPVYWIDEHEVQDEL